MLYCIFGIDKGVPYGAREKRYIKNLAKYIRLSRQPRQWLWCEHLGKLFVLQTAFEEFVLGQLSVVVLVHFGEYVFGPVFCRVGRTVGRTRAQHIVDGLNKHRRFVNTFFEHTFKMNDVDIRCLFFSIENATTTRKCYNETQLQERRLNVIIIVLNKWEDGVNNRICLAIKAYLREIIRRRGTFFSGQSKIIRLKF